MLIILQNLCGIPFKIIQVINLQSLAVAIALVDTHTLC